MPTGDQRSWKKIRSTDFNTNTFFNKQKYSIRPQRDYFIIFIFAIGNSRKLGELFMLCVFSSACESLGNSRERVLQPRIYRIWSFAYQANPHWCQVLCEACSMELISVTDWLRSQLPSLKLSSFILQVKWNTRTCLTIRHMAQLNLEWSPETSSSKPVMLHIKKLQSGEVTWLIPSLLAAWWQGQCFKSVLFLVPSATCLLLCLTVDSKHLIQITCSI